MGYANRNCRTCTHADLAAIDSMIAGGRPIAAIARRFGISYESVKRHAKAHIPPDMLRRLKAKALRAENAEALADLRDAEAENLLLRVTHTRARLNKILDSAEDSKDYRGAILAIKALHENYGLVGKLVGELTQGTQILNQSLVVSPDYLRLRALLITALAPFPAARIAVAKALRELEQPPAEAPKQIAAPIEVEASPIAAEPVLSLLEDSSPRWSTPVPVASVEVEVDGLMAPAPKPTAQVLRA
jgi:hypothetical protein